ncbi:MAG: bifunctional hydroxymethylpyrimidine kinase/phosphomethylpyrimidine kinase, partial [bacterium]|nr:bifunctional hydroxymethylpyrimidine kinase/phosphomethylpyrimidine kinase [bacterium]
VSRLYRKYHVPVLLKGGHLPDRAVDIFFAGKEMERFESELIEGVDTHGSGCSLASAITAVVARGEALEAAVERAKIYITHALKGALQLSPGCRVINHFPYPFEQF